MSEVLQELLKDSDSDREPDELDLIKFKQQIMITLESSQFCPTSLESVRWYHGQIRPQWSCLCHYLLFG